MIFIAGVLATMSISVKGAEEQSVYIPLTDIKRSVAPLHTKNKAVTGDSSIKRINNTIKSNDLVDLRKKLMLSKQRLDLAVGTNICYHSKPKKSPIEGFCKDTSFSKIALRCNQYLKYRNAKLLLIHHQLL